MKKNVKFIIAICFVLAGAVSAVSATPLDFDKSVGIYGLIGFDSEPETGGIHFQQWFDNGIGYQVQGYIYYSQNGGSNPAEYTYNVSAELNLKLYETPMGNRSATILYAWFLGGHKGFAENRYIDGDYKSSGYLCDFTLGLGFGFDIMFMNHISIPIEFGFAGEFPNAPNAGFVIGTGIRYRF